MSRWISQYLVIYNISNLPNSNFFAKVDSNFCKILNTPAKRFLNPFKILPKRNFAKSGHTASTLLAPFWAKSGTQLALLLPKILMLCMNDFHCDNSTHLNCKMQLTRSPCYKCHDLLQVQILLSAQRFRNPLELRQARGVLQLVVPHQLWVLLPRGLLCLHQSPGSWQRNPSGLSSFGNHCTKANDYVKTIV